MLLYLDGRDAPVSGAWVDRVSGQRCAISGATISHIADERCYSKSGSEKDRITMPDGILKATQLYTVQCVANDMRSEKGNGAFISIHAMQNIENSQFSIW
jgi:hypothetical protein